MTSWLVDRVGLVLRAVRCQEIRSVSRLRYRCRRQRDAD